MFNHADLKRVYKSLVVVQGMLARKQMLLRKIGDCQYTFDVFVGIFYILNIEFTSINI